MKTKTYYQPEAYFDDGTNINYGSIPEELHSFQAFPTREMCEKWLIANGYNRYDFIINEYHDDDIEDVVLIDEDGDEYIGDTETDTRTDSDLNEFAQDLYDVLGLNTDNCTQKEFFNKYVENDDAFMIDSYTDEEIIYFDDFTITIKRNK